MASLIECPTQIVSIWDTRSPTQNSFRLFHHRPVLCSAWSSDESHAWLADGCEDGSVSLWRISAVSLEKPVFLHPEWVLQTTDGSQQKKVISVSWRPDGGQLAVLHEDRVLRFWEFSRVANRWFIAGSTKLSEIWQRVIFSETGRL